MKWEKEIAGLYITTPNILREEIFLTFQMLPGLLLQLLVVYLLLPSASYRLLSHGVLEIGGGKWIGNSYPSFLATWRYEDMLETFTFFFSASAVLLIFSFLLLIGGAREERWENSLNFFPKQKWKDIGTGKKKPTLCFLLHKQTKHGGRQSEWQLRYSQADDCKAIWFIRQLNIKVNYAPFVLGRG